VKRILALVLIFCLVFCAVPPAALAGDVRDLSVTATQRFGDAFSVLSKVNQERKALGLGALTMDRELLKRAMLRAAEIEVLFSHDRPDGQSCFTVFPQTEGMMGENIASGYDSAGSVFDGWKGSPPHYENIKGSEWLSTGIGCLEAPDGTLYWVQLFSSQTPDRVTRDDCQTRQKKTFAVKATAKNAKEVFPSLPIKVNVKKAARLSAGKCKISWAKDKNADGYVLEYARNKEFTGKKTVKISSGQTLSKTLSKLKKGKTYYVRVRSYTARNGVVLWGAYGKRKSVTV